MPDRMVSPGELGELSRLLAAEAMELLREELQNKACNPERVDAYAHVVDAVACFSEDSDD
jgi:hypothetical protein